METLQSFYDRSRLLFVALLERTEILLSSLRCQDHNSGPRVHRQQSVEKTLADFKVFSELP